MPFRYIMANLIANAVLSSIIFHSGLERAAELWHKRR